jgi:hypothetical protein
MLLAADNGDAQGYPNATHEAIGPRLGPLRDANALAANQLASGDAWDEDGVAFSLLRAGQSATMTVNVQNAPAGAKLDAWIDFGGNFNWTTAGDQIADNLAVVAGDNVVTFNVPAGALGGFAYARVRLSTAGNLNSTGAAANGEVEDYLLPIANPDSGPFAGQDAVSFNDTTVAIPVDLDSDGDFDILNGRLAWIENLDGRFGVETPIDFGAATALAAADVDHDGDMDVLAMMQSASRLSWFENNGNQLFTQRTIASGVSVVAISPVDFDEDGDLDVVATSTNLDRIDWYENNGAQAFALHTIASVADPVSGIPIDFDDDGDLDVVAASAGSKTILWYENTGSATYSLHPIASALPLPTSLSVVDLDDDGDLDLLAGIAASNSVVWLENDGANVFASRVIEAANATPLAVLAADLDGDGDLDVASSTSQGRVTWYENDGDQLFAGHAVLASTGFQHALAAADFDRDGRLDLLTTGTVNTPTAWYRNIADYDYGDAPMPYGGVYLQDNGARHVAVGPTLGALRDAEADGVRTATSGSGGEAEDDGVVFGALQLGQSAGLVTVQLQNAPSGARLDAWIDFDGDGSWGGAGEQIFASMPVVQGANQLAFAIPSRANSGATYARFRISTAGGLGIDGAALDGEVEDLALNFASREPATGLFGAANPISNASPGFAFMVTADVDGDGDIDVVVKTGGSIAWHENLGGAGFVEHAVPSSSTGSEDIAAGDLDGDGDVDFVGLSPTAGAGQLIWMENDGQQSFTRRIAPLSLSLSSPTALALADMDADGDMDVLAANLSPGGVYLFINNGQQQFTQRFIGALSDYATSVVAADVDQDGDLDAIAGGPDVVWLQNDGALNFSARTVKGAGQFAGSTEGVAVGDMDGDGDFDVVAVGATSFSLPFATVFWQEQIDGNTFVSHIIDFGRSLRWATLADFDVDGDLDILASGFTSSIDLYENLGAGQFILRQISAGQGGATQPRPPIWTATATWTPWR